MNNTNELLRNLEITEILRILSKPAKQRTDDNLEKCYEYFSKMKFFAQLSMEMSKMQIKAVIRELLCEKFQTKQFIFTIGDIGRRFYIILQGSVAIMRPTEIKDEQASGKEFAKKLKSDNKKMLAQYLQFFSDDVEEEIELDLQGENEEVDEIRKHLKQKYKSFSICQELLEGDSFGEVALRTEGYRTASAIAMSETYLLGLTANSYYNVLKSYHDNIYNEKLNFLRSIRIFKNWTLAAIHQLLFFMQTYIGHRGDVIYRQNDPTKYLYFIRSGEVELVQYVDVLITKDPDLNEQLLNTIRRNVHKTKFTNKTEHKLCILGVSEMFGDKEIFMKINRQNEARVRSSECEIYYISKKIFFSSLATFLLIRDMHKNSQIKNDWHEQFVQNNQISSTKLVFEREDNFQKTVPIVSMKPNNFYMKQGIRPQKSMEVSFQKQESMNKKSLSKLKTEGSIQLCPSFQNSSLKDLINHRKQEFVFGRYQSPKNEEPDFITFSKGLEGANLQKNDSSLFFTMNKQIEEVKHEFEEEEIDDEYLKEKFQTIPNETKDTKDLIQKREEKPQKHISCITLYSIKKNYTQLPEPKIINRRFKFQLPYLQQVKKAKQKRDEFNSVNLKRVLKFVS